MPPAWSLFDEFEYRGEWWIPADQGRRIPGVLTVRKGEPRLLLMGSLPAAEGSLKTQTAFAPELIHGEATDGTWITLYRSIAVRQTFGFGPSHSEFVADSAVIGGHYDAAAAFRHLGASFTGLDDWAWHLPFEQKATARGPDETGPRVRRMDLSFEPPAETRVSVPDRSFDLVIEYEMRTGGDGYAKRWDYETFLEIEGAEPKPLDWLLRIRDELRTMLAFLVGEPVFTRRLRAESAEGEPVAVYQTQRGAADQADRRPQGILLPLPTIRDAGLEDRIRQWFGVVSRFKPTIDLYLGTVYPPSTFVEFEFVALMQALEGFHRRRYPDRYVPETEYEAITRPMMQAVPAGTPGPLRSKLGNMLKYGNEYSLRKRLGQILGDLADPTFALVSARPRSEFTETVVNARNYWAHQPLDAADAPLKGRDLHRANPRIQLLLHVLLLKEVGFDEALIVSRILEHDRLRSFADPT